MIGVASIVYGVATCIIGISCGNVRAELTPARGALNREIVAALVRDGCTHAVAEVSAGWQVHTLEGGYIWRKGAPFPTKEAAVMAALMMAA